MVSWRQSFARTMTMMHLGEQDTNSSKKKIYFHCSCTFHCSHTLLVHFKLKLELKILVLKVEAEAGKLKTQRTKDGTMVVLQFLSTARASTQEWIVADIEGWRMAINRSFLSTKKAWIFNTITSLLTSNKFINQSQYQKYSYRTKSDFRIIFLRVLQTTISHSLKFESCN